MNIVCLRLNEVHTITCGTHALTPSRHSATARTAVINRCSVQPQHRCCQRKLFKVTGTLLEYTVVAASDRSTTNCFCGNCVQYEKLHSSYLNLVVIALNWMGIDLGDLDEYPGTNLDRYGDAFGGFDGDRVIQAGCLDDLGVLNANPPRLEMFRGSRVDWVKSLEAEGVPQFDGMP